MTRATNSPPRVDLDRPLERINLDLSISIRCVRTTEQLTHMLTTSAYTTIQPRSLMQFFDIPPPPKWNVDRFFQNHFVLQSFRKPLKRYLMSTAISATSKIGLGKRSWKIPQQELKLTPLGDTQCQQKKKKTLRRGHPTCSSEEEEIAEPDACWQ